MARRRARALLPVLGRERLKREQPPGRNTGRRIATPGGWRATLIGQVRGLSGGLVIGVTFLFTMEVWWVGRSTPPSQVLLLLLLGVGFVVVDVDVDVGTDARFGDT
ncbi:DUF2391 family protein [Kocuria oceani]|nr:DUF2391 family protein [Kocuria oceani]